MAGKGGLAEQIRTGLDEEQRSHRMSTVASRQPQNTDPLDELSFRKPIRQHIKEFGAIIGAICLLIAAVKFYKGGVLTPTLLTIFAVTFSGVAYTAPRSMRPVWELWMKLAHALSIVMTTLILGIAWYIVLIPIALLLKLLRTKVMDCSFKAPVTTYWEVRNEKYDDFRLLERQF